MGTFVLYWVYYDKKERIECVKWQRCLISICCALALTLTGCSVRVPVITPNETNVLEYAKSVIADISDIHVKVQGSFAYGQDMTGVLYEYQGQVQGSLQEVLYSKVACTQQALESDTTDVWSVSSKLSDEIELSDDILESEKQWYFDVVSGTYYEKTLDSDWVGYLNGDTKFDLNWWLHQLDNTAFQYDGETTDSKGNTVFSLNAIYSGDMIQEVFDHLGLTYDVSADTSDICLNLYVDRWSGFPTELKITSADTGSQIFVTTEDGPQTLTLFDFRLLFSNESHQVSLPTEFDELELQMSDEVVSNMSVEQQDAGLVYQDMVVSVEPNDVFDMVSYSDNRIDVSSSLVLDGQPVMSVMIVDGEDAYVRAVSDKNSILSFYDEQGLSEMYVSDDITQCLIAGHVGYVYESQYTEWDYAYVCQEAFAYVELQEDVFVKVSIRSLTDQGESVVLTESYIDAMLSQLVIGGVAS